MGAALLKTGAAASTAEQRRAFVDACKPIQEVPEVRLLSFRSSHHRRYVRALPPRPLKFLRFSVILSY